ncbi:hypothetical protein FQN57_002762 [Myotisia sp. PD_48]|nr:hypothetical protein FQN57_002762 [Myotisia sp. PD_48]
MDPQVEITLPNAPEDVEMGDNTTLQTSEEGVNESVDLTGETEAAPPTEEEFAPSTRNIPQAPEKLGLSKLKQLAHSKIHRIKSTAKGEIAYARYVYSTTPNDDVTIRKPVAAFWATRSHVLRHEAESEFRSLCIEHPQFGFDVLNLVLDLKEKRSKDRDGSLTSTPAPKGSARKRARPI